MKSIQAVSYFVHFEDNGYIELNKLVASKSYSSIFILVDENTHEHCYSKFIPNLATTSPIEIIEIESGEIHKNLETCMGPLYPFISYLLHLYKMLIKCPQAVIASFYVTWIYLTVHIYIQGCPKKMNPQTEVE